LGTRTFGESSIESVISLPGSGAIRLTTARFMTPAGRQIQGKGLGPDLAVTPLKLEMLPQGATRREADLRGALKNTDPIGPRGESAMDLPHVATVTSSVATIDIGSANDEQLRQAVDVLHGLALVSGRDIQ